MLSQCTLHARHGRRHEGAVPHDGLAQPSRATDQKRARAFLTIRAKDGQALLPAATVSARVSRDTVIGPQAVSFVLALAVTEQQGCRRCGIGMGVVAAKTGSTF